MKRRWTVFGLLGLCLSFLVGFSALDDAHITGKWIFGQQATFAPPYDSNTAISVTRGKVDLSGGVIQGASPFVFEGATDNGYETTLAVTDPTADRTITLPNYTGTVFLSTLSTNAPDVANSVWGVSGGIKFEGATADAYETLLQPVEPTSTNVLNLPNASGDLMISSLSGNAPDIANSVWGVSNGFRFEGATANDFETTIAPADPTADRTVTLADASGTVMLSSLATNAPDVANAIWGVSGGLKFEGATADAYETTLTVAEPTAARTITLPDATGTVMISGTNGAATHDYEASSADWTLTALEAEANVLTVSNAGGASNAILTSCRGGKFYAIVNGSGQTITFKVTGQSGGTVANGKNALYVCNGTDVVEISEQP